MSRKTSHLESAADLSPETRRRADLMLTTQKINQPVESWDADGDGFRDRESTLESVPEQTPKFQG